ncbi:MAG: prepilin-type N-terminal cleavage/methylation domain-containing protein [Campylobacterales bacterium]|nr:prepilin-type N-terminal cleavage/methylation domain-containing protein [Campylobacterales bacterium]
MKTKRKNRNGFSLIELIFVIIIIGGLAIYATNYAVGQSDKIEVSSVTSQINRDISIALSDYKRNYYRSGKKYSEATAETIFMYLPNSNDYELTGTGATSKINHRSLLGFYFEIAPDSYGGVNELKYKVYFDGSEAKAAKGWSDDKARQIESDIASHFTRAYDPNTIVGGESTSLGAANIAVAASNINEDLKIAIGGCGK